MLEIVEMAEDGSRRYRMTHEDEVCEFVIARRGRRIWGCSGVTFRARVATPGVPADELEPTSLCHEDGWLVWRPSSAGGSVPRWPLVPAGHEVEALLGQLSRGQRAVVEVAVHGAGTEELGLATGKDPATALTTLSRARRKLGLSSTPELVALYWTARCRDEVVAARRAR